MHTVTDVRNEIFVNQYTFVCALSLAGTHYTQKKVTSLVSIVV